MLMICSKVISNSPEGLQQSLDVIYNHAQEYLSGNGNLVVKAMQGKFLAKRLLK